MGTIDRRRSDVEIAADLARALRSDRLAQIRTEVTEGVVTLTGSVHTWSEWCTAQRTVERIEGVRDVRNEIDLCRPEAELARVRDVMSGIRACPCHANALEALDLLWRSGLGGLPVIDDGGRLVGMVTEHEVALAAFLRARAPARIPVQEVARRTVMVVSPDDPAGRAALAMREQDTGVVPVLDDDGHLVGLVTFGDLASANVRPTSIDLSEEP